MRHWRTLWLLSALLLYLLLATYQLGLPGLHYDEAKEAGVNAVELLKDLPVSAFRDASVTILGWRLPLMVQDYIGALNVYLSLPFLELTGIGVPNLRFLAVLTGLIALITVERSASTYITYIQYFKNAQRYSHIPPPASHTPLSLAGLIAITLLAASPSFVFWSRQGIFVTNLIQPLCFAAIWQGLSWLHTGRPRSLVLSAFWAGLALYAKLLAIWIIGPFALMAMCTWLWFRVRGEGHRARLSLPLFVGALIAFTLPLLPLIVFNVQTGGTFSNVSQNLGQSYYGVDNLHLLQNIPLRWQQLLDTLRGAHLWYLGGVYSNQMAPLVALIAMIGGLSVAWRLLLPPLVLLASTFAFSLFTITDLFITHYAVVQVLLVAVTGIAVHAIYLSFGMEAPEESAKTRGAKRPIAFVVTSLMMKAVNFCMALLLLLWLLLDLATSLQYHGALSQSGGLSDHSDASYDLAYYLRFNGVGVPIVLDWGMDATVRYLSEGTVRPVEIFGYASPAAPDDGFAERLALFLGNADNVYLLRGPGQAVFAGRRELFFQQAMAEGLTPTLEAQFDQRDGTPLFELWRAVEE